MRYSNGLILDYNFENNWHYIEKYRIRFKVKIESTQQTLFNSKAIERQENIIMFLPIDKIIINLPKNPTLIW